MQTGLVHNGNCARVVHGQDCMVFFTGGMKTPLIVQLSREYTATSENF